MGEMVMFAHMADELEQPEQATGLIDILDEAFGELIARGIHKDSIVTIMDDKGKSIIVPVKYEEQARVYSDLYEQNYGVHPHITFIRDRTWKDILRGLFDGDFLLNGDY